MGIFRFVAFVSLLLSPSPAMSTSSESSSVVTMIEKMQRRTEETQPWNRMMAGRDNGRGGGGGRDGSIGRDQRFIHLVVLETFDTRFWSQFIIHLDMYGQ